MSQKNKNKMMKTLRICLWVKKSLKS